MTRIFRCAQLGSRGLPTTRRSLDASTAKYQLVMLAYAAEAGPMIDPMTFTPAPSSEAGIGPLSIKHVAGIAPVKGTKPPSTLLLGADGKTLGTTLGRWERARGKVAFTCVSSKRRATSTLTGLPSRSHLQCLCRRHRVRRSPPVPAGSRPGETLLAPPTTSKPPHPEPQRP